MADAQTVIGDVLFVETRLNIRDILGAVLVRLGFNRMTYLVSPGLYAVGSPDQNSPVFVSANYKLSFDVLRKNLRNIDAWILVIDTHAVNVWCSAGKGSFSAEEVANRIKQVSLGEIVSHRSLILPQLAAVGVAAHKVRELTGFSVKYGPVRANDIRRYLHAGMKADDEMRRMRFPLVERLKLTPIEFRFTVQKFAIPIVLILFIVLLVAKGAAAWHLLDRYLVPVIGAFAIGTVAVPALLPWIPFRSFVLKGFVVGLIWAAIASSLYNVGELWTLGNFLLLPSIVAYCSLSFTGATTYTSPSGVNKEIRLYARPVAIAAILGLVITTASIFVK